MNQNSNPLLSSSKFGNHGTKKFPIKFSSKIMMPFENFQKNGSKILISGFDWKWLEDLRSVRYNIVDLTSISQDMNIFPLRKAQK